MAAELESSASLVEDHVWRLPLHPGYECMLKSKVANVMSTPYAEGGLAGAITAALFLQRFVSQKTPWIHFDTMCYTMSRFARPGQPEGGEPTPARALFTFLANKYK